jgi:predicted DNA-binding transcriptional regulator AlpA
MNKAIPPSGKCRFIRIHEVLVICGMSRTTLYREIKAQNFPAPVKIAARSVAWLEDEVAEWMATKVRQRAMLPLSK